MLVQVGDIRQLARNHFVGRHLGIQEADRNAQGGELDGHEQQHRGLSDFGSGRDDGQGIPPKAPAHQAHPVGEVREPQVKQMLVGIGVVQSRLDVELLRIIAQFHQPALVLFRTAESDLPQAAFIFAGNVGCDGIG